MNKWLKEYDKGKYYKHMGIICCNAVQVTQVYQHNIRLRPFFHSYDLEKMLEILSRYGIIIITNLNTYCATILSAERTYDIIKKYEDVFEKRSSEFQTFREKLHE